MKITYYGHSCFLVDTGTHKLLFDPFITPNPLAKDIDVEAVEADFILLSHGHADHVADAVPIAKRTGATVISNYEIVTWLAGQGVENGVGMNLGGAAAFDFGRLKYVNAIHSSSLPDGTYGGNPGGFVVEAGAGRLYYSGDTALTSDMQFVAGTPFDFAVLCIGDHFTMGVDDAIRAAQLVGASRVMGVHYDTFPPIVIDRAEAIRKFADAMLELHLPAIGASIEL